MISFYFFILVFYISLSVFILSNFNQKNWVLAGMAMDNVNRFFVIVETIADEIQEHYM